MFKVKHLQSSSFNLSMNPNVKTFSSEQLETVKIRFLEKIITSLFHWKLSVSRFDVVLKAEYDVLSLTFHLFKSSHGGETSSSPPNSSANFQDQQHAGRKKKKKEDGRGNREKWAFLLPCQPLLASPAGIRRITGCEAQLDTGSRRSGVSPSSCKRGIGFTASSPSGVKTGGGERSEEDLEAEDWDLQEGGGQGWGKGEPREGCPFAPS